MGDAVTGVSAEEEKIFVFGMGAEDGDEVFGDEDGAAPAVGDANVFQSRMKRADAPFERF